MRSTMVPTPAEHKAFLSQGGRITRGYIQKFIKRELEDARGNGFIIGLQTVQGFILGMTKRSRKKPGGM